MKSRYLLTLPLAAALVVPAGFAQNTSSSSDQAQAPASQTVAPAAQTQSAPEANGPNTNNNPELSAHQPLQQDTRQGFWGKLNPFARKKYVQRQMQPIRDRMNELDELSATNSKNIKDVDSRAQSGIQQASLKADQADQHAPPLLHQRRCPEQAGRAFGRRNAGPFQRRVRCRGERLLNVVWRGLGDPPHHVPMVGRIDHRAKAARADG